MPPLLVVCMLWLSLFHAFEYNTDTNREVLHGRHPSVSGFRAVSILCTEVKGKLIIDVN